MKPIHSKCNFENLFSDEEIKFDENMVYPRWVEEI
jgi:hypothetical protein